jgi:signal peptidase complex subunit 2
LILIFQKIDNEVEEEELTVEEVPQPHIIETGDSVKVKQVLDDSAMEAIKEAGFQANYSWDNLKLLLMFLSCVFAMVAQFYPMPFPDSRLLLFCCCACYFIISSILQFIVMFVDKDTIMFTNANKVKTFCC